MKRLLLVAIYGALALPLGVALCLLVSSFWEQRQMGVTFIVTPFADWNGHPLPFWPCMAGIGAVGGLAFYALMCGLFRVFK